MPNTPKEPEELDELIGRPEDWIPPNLYYDEAKVAIEHIYKAHAELKKALNSYVLKKQKEARINGQIKEINNFIGRREKGYELNKYRLKQRLAYLTKSLKAKLGEA